MKNNNKKHRQLLAIGILLIGLLCQACTYRNQESIVPKKDCTEIVPDTVSFKQDIEPILTNNCSKAGCHSGVHPEGNFNLEASVAYDQLTEAGSGYIDTITPRYSVVYSSLVSTSDPMPPTGKLSQCDIDMIEKWMKQGAKNN